MKEKSSPRKTLGICFGGYCPLHQGHMDVIMEAKKQNDACYVIVCGYNNEPRGWEINLDIDSRYEIIKNFFADDEQIIVKKINDTEIGIDESMSESNWITWQSEVKNYVEEDKQNRILDRDCQITWYVAEPFYRVSIEKNNVLNAKVELMERLNNVSGTAIRKNPIKYWNKITEPFKKYLTKNILVIGTASEGKSTLVKDISKYFGIPYAEEYGRIYMTERNLKDQNLTVSDFANFLEGQFQLSKSMIEQSHNGLFISDTDACVTLMYAAAYIEDPDINIFPKDYRDILQPIAEKIIKSIKWDHIFIFPPSKEFVDDGSRYMKQSTMDERTKNFTILQKLVNEYYPEESKTYLVGSFLENFNEVKNYINTLL